MSKNEVSMRRRDVLQGGMAASAALAIGGTSLLASTGRAFAAEVEVKMLNQGADGSRMVFEPALVKIQLGDTVKFVATDKGHNVEYIAGMVPDGVEIVKSPLGQDVSITFDTAGAYGYKCTPHVFMGMVGIVLVGDAPDVAGVKATQVPPKAREKFDALLAGESL